MNKMFLSLLCLLLFIVSMGAVSAVGDANQTDIDDSASALQENNEILCVYETSDLLQDNSSGDYNISAPDLTKYFKGPERFVVTVNENNLPLVNKSVYIVLNNVTYNRITDENGQASMAINLNSGVYNVTSGFENNTVQSTITVKSTVCGNDITKIFRNATQYYATFVDTAGNLMANASVKFNINGVFYTRITNGSGVARMNINLNLVNM